MYPIRQLVLQEEAASVRAEAAAAQSQLRKATAYASSLTAARAVADEKARKLREAADRLAPPKWTKRWRATGGRLPRFSKFASVNEDLPSENLPLCR